MKIDLYGVSVSECETEYGDYVVDFYLRDYSRDEVEKEIPDRFEVVHKEHSEGGELVTWFISAV